MAVRPNPIRAPAVIMAPQRARMDGSFGRKNGVAVLLPEHAQAAAAYQENTGQDDEKTTASARGPGAVGPARTIVPVEILGTHSTRETWIYHWTPPSPKVQSLWKLSGRATFFAANTMPASIVQFRGPPTLSRATESP